MPRPLRAAEGGLARGAVVGQRGEQMEVLAAHTEAGDPPGWDIIQVPYSDSGWWSEHLASFGADVVVLEPADLREAVIGRLKGVLA